MPAVPTETLLALWYRAQEHELGTVIRLTEPSVDDIKRMSQMLYNARTEHGDESLSEIMLCLPAGAQEIFLVKKTVQLKDFVDA